MPVHIIGPSHTSRACDETSGPLNAVPQIRYKILFAGIYNQS